MDLVSHIYRSVRADGYRGTPIHNLYRDEVQDFAQAELLMDLRCVPSLALRSLVMGFWTMSAGTLLEHGSVRQAAYTLLLGL